MNSDLILIELSELEVKILNTNKSVECSLDSASYCDNFKEMLIKIQKIRGEIIAGEMK